MDNFSKIVQRTSPFLRLAFTCLATVTFMASGTASIYARMQSPNASQKSQLSLDLLEIESTQRSTRRTNPFNNSASGSSSSKSKKTTLSLDSLDDNGGSSETGSSNTAKTELKDETTNKGWRDNLRQTVDVSFRPVYSGPTGNFGVVTAVGVDLLKVFSNKDGDWGVLTMQNYLTRIDNINPPNQTQFDDRHDFELVYRIFNFNYTGAGRGKPNFRIGHFELPFGLEHVNNTNGTIRDFTHLLNFGLDTDWGVSLNGATSGIEYEVGLTRGSGNNFRRRDDPFIIAGRVGTPRDDTVALGVSALHGEVLQFGPLGGTSRRTRVGIDGTWSDEKFVWLGELSAGFQDNDRAYTALLEADWFNRDESLLIYNQLVVRGIGSTTDWDNEVRHSIGFRRQCDRHWAYSGQLSHFFDQLGSLSRGTEVVWQARYRF